MNVQTVVGGFAALVFLTTPAVGQASPDGRASLVINEIMPTPGENGHAWIELFNQTSESVSLVGVFLKTSLDRTFEIPGSTGPTDPPNELPPGAYLLVLIDAADDEGFFEPAPSGRWTLHAPAWLASSWTPSHGELAMYREIEEVDPHQKVYLDYVAWGGPGDSWSEKYRINLWPVAAFVPLTEGFGVYEPGTPMVSGSSIGLYPGSPTSTPNDWVPFDGDEVSPGGWNPVPRPKVFSLADGAEIGIHSFAVAWASRKGDDWYRFELSSDPVFDTIVLQESVASPMIMVGGDLPEGKYSYRVFAYSVGVVSMESLPRSVSLWNTECDWPLPPSPSAKTGLNEWLSNPSCNALPACGILSALRFKFQRKDTPLACGLCQQAGEFGCSWTAPHPHCSVVVSSNNRPSYLLCAQGALSRTCGAWPPNRGLASILGADWEITPAQAIPPFLDSSTVSEKSCDHGSQNCVRASISMIVSAYGGACLSQDVLAYNHFKLAKNYQSPKIPITKDRDLAHVSAMGCGDSDDGECSIMLRWALNIDSSVAADSNKYEFRSAAPLFSEIRTWIDGGRPIMTQGRFPHPDAPDCRDHDILHMRVLGGYCEGAGHPERPFDRYWVYVFDPKTGPRAEMYTSWKATAGLTWVTPPFGKWSSFQEDPPTVWRDSNGDGFVDFDQLRLPQNSTPGP